MLHHRRPRLPPPHQRQHRRSRAGCRWGGAEHANQVVQAARTRRRRRHGQQRRGRRVGDGGRTQHDVGWRWSSTGRAEPHNGAPSPPLTARPPSLVCALLADGTTQHHRRGGQLAQTCWGTCPSVKWNVECVIAVNLFCSYSCCLPRYCLAVWHLLYLSPSSHPLLAPSALAVVALPRLTSTAAAATTAAALQVRVPYRNTRRS